MVRETKKMIFYKPSTDNFFERPLVNENISAGFPSPAEDLKK